MNLTWLMNRKLLNDLAELRERINELEVQLEEIKRERETLEKTNSLFRTVFETIPDQFAIIDKNHRIIFSNWLGGYDYVTEPLRSGTPFCYEAFYGRKVPCEPCHCLKVFESGEHVISEKLNPKIGWVKIHAYPVFDDSGNTTMVVEHIRNITDKKQALMDLKQYREHLVEMVDERTAELNQANKDLTRENAVRREVEKELRESEEQFRVMTVSAQDAIIMMDNNGRVSFWNEAAERIFGYSKQETIGKVVHEILAPPRYLEQYLLAFPTWRITGQGAAVNKTIELTALRKDGSEIPVELSLASVKIKERWNAISVIRDISERKQAEMEIRKMNKELQQKSEQLLAAQEELVRTEKLAILGQLAGSVGHELRNPLGVMSNAVYYLKSIQTNADESVKEYLDIINQEIANAGRIITDILDFSRTRTPQISPTDPFLLVSSSLKKCTVPKSIAVAIDVPDSLPLLKVDPLQMDQVLQNLVINACQAMPQGGSVTISARAVRKPRLTGQEPGEKIQQNGAVAVEPCRDYLEISVADSGEGISPENMKKLFQPLFTTKRRGIGLGLTLCRNFTEANGGRIAAESRPGEGTTFILTLPVEGGDAWKAQ